jgi:hypothetical protein
MEKCDKSNPQFFLVKSLHKRDDRVHGYLLFLPTFFGEGSEGRLDVRSKRLKTVWILSVEKLEPSILLEGS